MHRQSVLLLFLAALSVSLVGWTPLAPKVHPAVAVANEVLAAIATQDAKGLYVHLNATNREKLTLQDVENHLPEMKTMTAGAPEISALVEGRRFAKTGEVFAKVRVEGHEVIGLTLTLEDGHYRFEDIHSPSVESYEKLGKIWPPPNR